MKIRVKTLNNYTCLLLVYWVSDAEETAHQVLHQQEQA